MKLKIILTITFVLLVSACATKPESPHFSISTPEKRVEFLQHRLKLTGEKVDEIRPILQIEYEANLKLQQEMENADREGMVLLRQKKQDLDWDIYKQLSEHLDPDQMYLYSFILDEEEQARQKEIRERRDCKILRPPNLSAF